MRILGIDPGLATVGLGLLDAENSHTLHPIEWLTIETKAGVSLPDRLMEIERDLETFIRDSKPDIAVVEKLFFATNRQTAIDVAQARGVVLLTLQKHTIKIIEPTPLQLKHALTGDGSADKRQVQDMLARLLNLSELPHPDDAADALALAVYGALHANNSMHMERTLSQK